MNSINASLPSLTFARPQMLASNLARSDAKDDPRDNAVTTTKSVSLDVKQQAAARAAESAGSDLVAQAVRRAVEDKASLTFRTQEGDVVKIRLTSRSVSRAESGDAAATSISSQTRLSVKIKGEINSEERAAIQAIVEKVETLARDFFNGDVKKAFAAAAELQLDPAQLASFALKLRHRERTTGGAQETPTVQLPPAAKPAAEASAPATNTPAAAPVAAPVASKPATAAATQPAAKPVAAPSTPKPATQPAAATPATEPVPTTAPNPASVATPIATPAAEPASSPVAGSVNSAALNEIGKTIGSFLAKLFDALEISLNKVSETGNQQTDGATRVEFSARFKLELFFQAVQTLAAAAETESEDEVVATATGDSSDPTTWPGDRDSTLTVEQTASSDPATTSAAVEVLDQVLEASIEAGDQSAAPVDADPADAAPVAAPASKLSLTAMAQYESNANGSFRMSLSINMRA
ncbi:MAG: hypothetical protein IPG25_08400 [Proteobacteria bacterium]|nr:hypothetical protein [Pseudomonadota bacterium]